MKRISRTSLLISCAVILAIGSSALPQVKRAEELWQRSKSLGTPVKEFPPPQAVSGFDEIPADSPAFKARIAKRPVTGPTPRPSYEERRLVKASGANGTIYEAFCGRYDAKILWPGPGMISSNQNTDQTYEPHLGYGFNPPDIFIGKRERGRIRTQLYFRDAGSHETAPHHISVDPDENVHLIVSDVNISDNNELNVYVLIGNPANGKWLEAWLVDRRGFTSWSHPWSGHWRGSVHLLWDWGDASYDVDNPSMGLFYVDRTAAVFGKKVRVINGLIESYDAAIDMKTGRLLVAAATAEGVFVTARSAAGKWTKPVLLDGELKGRDDVSVAFTSGNFVVRTANAGRREFVLSVGAE